MFMRRASHILILILMLLVVSAGVLGVDFGSHWDEPRIIGAVTRSIQTGVLLPRYYNYPSFCYDLTLLGLLPRIAWASSDLGIMSDIMKMRFKPIYRDKLFKLQERLILISQSQSFKLCTRVIFILVSYLSIFWVYVLVLAWRKIRAEAILASCFLGLSWEVSYHARWIAPDVIMMQFIAFALMCLFLARANRNSKLWLNLSIIGAGFASATKYPGGLFMLPIFLVIYYDSREKFCAKDLLRKLGKAAFLFFFINLAITPGIIVEPIRFAKEVISIIWDYMLIGHGEHTVIPGMPHILLMIKYICMSLFSKYPAISAFFFILAIIGIIRMIIDDKREAAVFLSFPVLYIFCMSFCKVMIVRNLIVLAPFFAILASRGCVFLYAKIKPRLYSVPFAICILALLSINMVWLLKAANSIRLKNRINYVAEAARYLDLRPATLFLVSGRVADELWSLDKKIRSNVRRDLSREAKAAIFYASEARGRGADLPNNQFNSIFTWFGPYEVNFNYYASWLGDDKIIMVPIESALKLDIFSND